MTVCCPQCQTVSDTKCSVSYSPNCQQVSEQKCATGNSHLWSCLTSGPPDWLYKLCSDRHSQWTRLLWLCGGEMLHCSGKSLHQREWPAVQHCDGQVRSVIMMTAVSNTFVVIWLMIWWPDMACTLNSVSDRVKTWFVSLWIYLFWLNYQIRLGLSFSKIYNTWYLLWILRVKRNI